MPARMGTHPGWRLLWLSLLPSLALAAIVTAAQIAQAVRDSPHANPWLRENADAVANLAVRVESGGETTAFNGSCCFGVLQMNTRNIRAFAEVTPEQYRHLDLQSQIDAWTKLTARAMQAEAPQTLAGIAIFDGRPVDSNLVLSCVQLGTGNCQRMISSGNCSGFADSNGTTICAMADRMVNGAGANVGATPGADTGVSSGPPQRNGTPATQSLSDGFQQGSGISMARMRMSIQGLVVALTVLIMGSALVILWRQFASGRIDRSELILYGQKCGLVVVIILLVMTVV